MPRPHHCNCGQRNELLPNLVLPERPGELDQGHARADSKCHVQHHSPLPARALFSSSGRAKGAASALRHDAERSAGGC